MAAYTVKYDATSESYPWDVVDGGDEVFESFETEAEALADMRERNAEAERDDLVERITEALDGADLATLRRLAALLKA